MYAKDFELTMLVPQPQLMEAEVSYTLTATTDFCVDEIVHTNQDNFQVVGMASNYLSPEMNESDKARIVVVTSHTCELEFCQTVRKSFCYALANEDRSVITNGCGLGPEHDLVDERRVGEQQRADAGGEIHESGERGHPCARADERVGGPDGGERESLGKLAGRKGDVSHEEEGYEGAAHVGGQFARAVVVRL